MDRLLLQAAKEHYQARYARAKANLWVYLREPVGVGEHSDIMEEVLTHIEIMEDAESCCEQIAKIEEEYQK